MSTKIESLRASYLRCQQQGDLVNEFFRIFTASHPVVKLLFMNSDIDRQKRLLENGIEYILSFENEYKRAVQTISSFHQKLTPSSSSKIMAIYLKYWKESFIKAVENIDPEYDKELEENWNKVLQFVINYINNNSAVNKEKRAMEKTS